MFAANFDLYGFRFSVQSDVAELLHGIREDFAFFATEDAVTGPVIELFDQAPPAAEVPALDASIYTPRNVVYRSGHFRYVDYHGRALGIRDDRNGHFKLYSREPGLLYEATYLYLLAEAGRELDRRHLHRIHALGVSIGGRAALVLLPMGGGKSTLALELMKYPEVRLLSDDSPYIARGGDVLAYPLRLGLLPGSEQAIPPEHRRVIDRMEFGPKHLVNYSFFKDRVEAKAPPGILFIGARMFGPGCRIEPVSKLDGLRACIANCVVGVGLFQGIEFLLQASGWELAAKGGLGISRLRNCAALVRRSRICRIHLGSNAELNGRTLRDYCLKFASGSK